MAFDHAAAGEAIAACDRLLATVESAQGAIASRATAAAHDWSGPFHEQFHVAHEHQRRAANALVEGIALLRARIALAIDAARDLEWQVAHRALQGGDVALAARAHQAGT